MNFFKRMGSASSSTNSVRSLSVDQKSDSKRPSSTKADNKEIRQLNEQLTNVQVLLDQSEKTNRTHQTDIDHLKQKLQTLECENEKLLEENQALEEHIETVESEPTLEAPYDISESLKIKEIEIAKLEGEFQSSEDNCKALRQKFKAKLKTIRGNNAKSKQEQSLKMFELKDEISALQHENEKLRGKLKVLGHTDQDGDSDMEETFDDKLSASANGHSNIIIELSTQISEQEYRISILESQIEEKDLIINKLQSTKLSPREAHSLIAVEAKKATEEMQSLAKELKMLKRKKKRAKAEGNLFDSNETAYSRELSSLSRDSGALDLSSPSLLKLDAKATAHKTETYSLLTPSHSATSFTSSSTLVT